MLGPDSVVQVNSGSFNGTSGTASLATAVDPANTVLLTFTIGGATPTAPTGFVRWEPSSAAGGGSAPQSLYARNAAAGLGSGESSWTIGGSSGPCSWVVLEVAGLDATAAVDAAVSFTASTTGTSLATGSVTTSTYDGMAVAVHASYMSTGGVPATFSGHTGGFTELVEQTATDGTKASAISVSVQYVQALGSYGCTATASASASLGAGVAVLTAAGARRAADVATCAGFEHGSTAALTNVNGQGYFESATGATVEAAAARTGSYGCRIQATGAAANVQWTSGQTVQVTRVAYRFRAALPSGDLDIGSFGGFVLRYRTASGKLGLQYPSGTEILSDATVAAGQWIGVDVRYDRTATTYTADWQVTYADGTDPLAQSQAASPSGQTAGVAGSLAFGWLGTATGNVDVDDIVVSRTSAHFPLGDCRIYPLLVDPAGTPTVSTAANFNTFTANGTMAAWNATTARGAVDDIPAVIGASADGVAQVTASTTDYVEFPCQTLDLAGLGAAIRGARLSVAGWAASSTAATISLRAFDGTTEHIIYAVADPNWDNASELWTCGMVKPSTGRLDWSQAKLDALAVRVGYSNDATPDIGIHAFVVEAVVRMAQTLTMFGAAGDVQVSATRDPDSAGIVSLTTTATATKGVGLSYDVSGTPTTATVPVGGSRTDAINAPDAPTVDYVAIYPDAEPYTG